MLRLSLTLLFLPLALVAVDPKSSGWPVFRGPDQTGVSPSKLPAKLDVLWQHKGEDSFENAVAVADGVVFAASMDEHVYALDLATGKLMWKKKEAPFRAAPAVRGGFVYAGDLDGKLHCFDKKTGDKKWSFEANSEIGGVNFHKDSILVSSHDEYLYSVSKDGKLLWKFHAEGPIHGAPAVFDGKTFLVGCDSMVRVLDLDTQKEIAKVDNIGESVVTAAVLGDKLYLGTMRNDVKAVDWKKAEISWAYKAGRNAQQHASSPAVTQKFVVLGGRDNKVHCLDRAKGDAVWVFPTGNKVDSSPVIAGDRVVVGSQDGKLYILDLATGKAIQTIPLDGPVTASPVVIDGKVLVGTQKGTLYCLGSKP